MVVEFLIKDSYFYVEAVSTRFRGQYAQQFTKLLHSYPFYLYISMPDNPLRPDSTSIEIGFSDSFSSTNGSPQLVDNSHRNILLLFLASYSWTLILTGIPLGFDLGPDYYKYRHWYTSDDVMRFVEPVGGLILNFGVLYKSGVFRKELDFSQGLWVAFFFFGAALYEQGAGFHSAANMFKNGLDTIDYDDTKMADMFYWMRTVWEHIISHYIYAVGYAIMTGVQLYFYREYKSGQHGLTTQNKALLVSTSFVYSLLIAGVAADFPSGILVGLLYLVLYGFITVGGWMFYEYRYKGETKMFTFGSRPIVHHFLLSYVFAFIMILIYIACVGGMKSRSEAGISTVN
jgi:hypothetical protein